MGGWFSVLEICQGVGQFGRGGNEANTYFFMVQAQGIMLRDNVRTIGHMIRLYTNKNATLNGTGGVILEIDALKVYSPKVGW
ncbi:beta-1,4-galactosyltransferase 6-like isoform X2 [Arapaima gigas]